LIIVGSDDGVLYVINSSFMREWGYKLNDSIRTSPIVSDLNNDQKFEIVVPAGNNLYVFGSRYGIYEIATTSTITSTTTSTTTTTSPTIDPEMNETTTSIIPKASITEISTTTTLEEPKMIGRVVGVEISTTNMAFVILLFFSVVVYILHGRRGR